MKIDELLESLPLSVARQYHKEWDRSESDAAVGDMFGTKMRLYIPLQAKENVVVGPIQKEISRWLYQNGYELVDYGKNRARDDKGRDRKLGSLLPKELVQKYANDPARSSSRAKSQTVVISRHPYDIAGMSTDRGWKSCMTIKHKSSKTGEEVPAGCNVHYVKNAVQEGSLIAYLISSDDTNIKNPIARVLINPYRNDDYETLYSIASNDVYGSAPAEFINTVEEWVHELNDKLNVEAGTYEMPDTLYADNDDNVVQDYEGADVAREKAQIARKERIIRQQFANLDDSDDIRRDLNELLGSNPSHEILDMLVTRYYPYLRYAKLSQESQDYILSNEDYLHQIVRRNSPLMNFSRASIQKIIDYYFELLSRNWNLVRGITLPLDYVNNLFTEEQLAAYIENVPLVSEVFKQLTHPYLSTYIALVKNNFDAIGEVDVPDEYWLPILLAEPNVIYQAPKGLSHDVLAKFVQENPRFAAYVQNTQGFALQ